MKSKYLVLIAKIMVLVFIFIIIGANINHVINTYNNMGKEKKVDCYDSYRNKIEDIECKQEITLENFQSSISILIVVSFLSFLFLYITFDSLDEIGERRE